MITVIRVLLTHQQQFKQQVLRKKRVRWKAYAPFQKKGHVFAQVPAHRSGTDQVHIATQLMSTVRCRACASGACGRQRVTEGPHTMSNAECRQPSRHEPPTRDPIWKHGCRFGLSQGVGAGRGQLEVAWAIGPGLEVGGAVFSLVGARPCQAGW